MPIPQAGVTRLEIRNFRGIEALDLDFTHPGGGPVRVGVLAGPNGCGKTAALEAVLIASGWKELAVGVVGANAIRKGADDYHLFVKAMDGRQGMTGEATSDPRSAGGAHFHCLYFSSRRTASFVGSLGITSGRANGAAEVPATEPLRRIKQFLINARARDLFTAAGRPKTSRFEEVVERINRTWSRFRPGESFVVQPIGDSPKDGFDVLVEKPGAEPLSVDVLSSGLLELFTFAGELAIDDSPPGIILVDEPELHLDPQWHRAFVQAILDLKPGWQLLVATHSPEVFDSVMSFERHFLVPDDDPRAKAWSAPAHGGESP